MTTVLVTGATGFIGRHVLPALQVDGFAIRALVRPARMADLPSGTEPLAVADITEADWPSLLAGVDAVVHLAGLAHAHHPAHALEQVNHRATASLAAAAQTAGARLVFVSSVRAQAGPAAPAILTEAMEAAPVDAYGASKLAAERAVAAAGGPFVILRPTLVYGPGVGGNMGALLRLAHSPLPLPFGAIRNARSLTAVDNLIAAIRLALASDASLCGTFLVADATPVSLADIIAHIRRGAGRRAGLLPLPPSLIAGPLRLIGRGDIWERLAGRLVVSTQRYAQVGYAPPVASADALAALGAAGHKDKATG